MLLLLRFFVPRSFLCVSFCCSLFWSVFLSHFLLHPLEVCAFRRSSFSVSCCSRCCLASFDCVVFYCTHSYFGCAWENKKKHKNNNNSGKIREKKHPNRKWFLLHRMSERKMRGKNRRANFRKTHFYFSFYSKGYGCYSLDLTPKMIEYVFRVRESLSTFDFFVRRLVHFVTSLCTLNDEVWNLREVICNISFVGVWFFFDLYSHFTFDRKKQLDAMQFDARRKLATIHACTKTRLFNFERVWCFGFFAFDSFRFGGGLPFTVKVRWWRVNDALGTAVATATAKKSRAVCQKKTVIPVEKLRKQNQTTVYYL